ncbi:MAG TPA: endonuclease/exonuclease/phosphatase family protein [Bryobacteraceae bacterium]|nr:endonuclease/exonuclease/phosphatase family protein [Bryobacteraceae bacterium]
MTLTVTTFNLENLFNRYAFLDMPWEERNYEKIVQAVGLASVASRAGDLVSYETTEIQRNNTAQAILDSEPDVLAVQEVENLYTLRLFNEEYLDNYFDRMLLIDGNDPRGIDVGFLVRKGFSAAIRNLRTHVDEAVPGAAVARSSVRNFGYLVRGALFSRDCLEVDLEIGNKTVTFLVNHFKAQDGTQDSTRRRKRQAQRVAELAAQAVQHGTLPVVLGDLNAPPDADGSLEPLLNSPVLQDPFPADTWTHYYVPAKRISRLDYILPHKALEVEDIHIVRKGLTTKCKQYQGERYPTVGPSHTEASDHCPVSVRLEVA